MMIEQWTGCYKRKWENVIPDTADYPANVAPSLALRIYFTAITRGYLTVGDTILNPFAGVGSLAFHALASGLNYFGIEADTARADLLRANLKRWDTQLAMLNNVVKGRVVSGDFTAMPVTVTADGVVGSLPYDPDPKQWPDYKLLAECTYAALRPGGVAIWVVRDFKERGVTQPVTESWIKGNEYVGFDLIHRAQALLLDYHGDQLDVDRQPHWRGKVYRSFFPRPDGRRKKVNVPHEDVLFFQKPL